MSNIGVIIWLVLLTVYVGYQDFATYKSWETRQAQYENRKEIYEGINERLKSLEAFINETINARSEHNEKYLHEH